MVLTAGLKWPPEIPPPQKIIKDRAKPIGKAAQLYLALTTTKITLKKKKVPTNSTKYCRIFNIILYLL